jgi:hypothetical protein
MKTANSRTAKVDSSLTGEEGKEARRITISAPQLVHVAVKIIGTAPLVINKMSARAKQKMRETQEAGQRSRAKRVREAKDFEQCAAEAAHVSEEGWYGLHAGGFRNAMIDACRMCGVKMTQAKMTIFVDADGYDRDDGTPLVKLKVGDPETSVLAVKNDSGVTDLRARPMWRKWEATVRMTYDSDQFHVQDVVNLLHRAGVHVGVGEGRPFSKNSAGCGWGTFTVQED